MSGHHREMSPRNDICGIFPCADGILLSKGYVGPRLENTIFRYGGIQEFLRWKGPIIGDSGAWLYKYEDEPPYSVRGLLEYYARLKISVLSYTSMSLKLVKCCGTIFYWTDKYNVLSILNNR
jgi:hypothetical protein